MSRLRTDHNRPNYQPGFSPDTASAIHSSALSVLAVKHRPYRAVPLWYWQSDIGHTERCPCGTGSHTSAIHSSALAVWAVRHRPYRVVPLVLAVTHRSYRAVPLVLAVRQQNICCSPALSLPVALERNWPDHTPVTDKLFGSLEDLQCTATSFMETCISI